MAVVGLLVFSPVLFALALLIWLQDNGSPFYIAPRVGIHGVLFPMVKFRSMALNADKTGVDSTSADDQRITKLGHFIRRYKLDEIPTLFNVICGQMSLVGPRPNVKRDVDIYTEEEMHLLDIRPGITDISSIVFSDEGEILKSCNDPDLRYNQVVRPWKSRLGLFYVKKRTFLMDIRLIILTVVALFSRRKALTGVRDILQRAGADDQLLEVAFRTSPLEPYPPPGADRIVTAR